MCESIQKAIAQRNEYINLLNRWGFSEEALSLTNIRVARADSGLPKYLETRLITSPGRMNSHEWNYISSLYPKFVEEWEKGNKSTREWLGGDVSMLEVFPLCKNHAQAVLGMMAYDQIRGIERLVE